MKLSASALSFSLCLTLSSACKAEPPAGLEPSTETPPVAAQPDVRADTLQDRLEQLTATDPDGDTALPITVNGETLPHPVWQATLMPGESLDLVSETPVALAVDDAEPASLANTHQYTAPDTPGVHQLRLFDLEGGHVLISVFVLKPLNGQEVVEGYRIGRYPQNAPEGLIRVTEDDLATPVSPNFTLGQFLCKQQPGHWPKFVLVSPSLLNRLEALLAELQSEELTDADSFFVMSGFRTPFYNTAIGSARLSRHMYGDAADIYPDVEGNDSVIDDLNGDGRVSRADANFLYDFADRLFQERSDLNAGGIGAYGANAVHGPFVHIDGRGSRARWGRGES